MRFGSIIELDRYDLIESKKDKPLEDIGMTDFKHAIFNLIQSSSIVFFNEYDDTPTTSILLKTMVFRNKYGKTGEIKDVNSSTS